MFYTSCLRMMLTGKYYYLMSFGNLQKAKVFTVAFVFRWQARREGDRVMRAGLIPSRALQEGRIIHERQTDPQTLDGAFY